jgi:hypothetical protein
MTSRNISRGDGRTGTRLHGIWNQMRWRTSPGATGRSRRNYFDRGIRTCDEWQDFPTFRAWALTNGYRDDLTIERVDNDGNYEPANCAWIPRAQQPRNQRRPKRSIVAAAPRRARQPPSA